MNKIVNQIMDRIGRITVMVIVFIVNVLIYEMVSKFWAGVFVVFTIFLLGFLICTGEED